MLPPRAGPCYLSGSVAAAPAARRVNSLMQIIVNGEPQEAPAGETVANLVERLGLARSACAVEVNRELTPRARHAEHTLRDGDTVEIVTLVGGG